LRARAATVFVFLWVLVAATAPAAADAVEELIYEKAFEDWTAKVVKDLVLLRNNCRLEAIARNGAAEPGPAMIRFDLIRRAHSTTWSSAVFLPHLSDKSEIVLSVDNTLRRDLHGETVSSNTAYLSDEFTVLVLADFFTGELLGENVQVRYRTATGADRSAGFSLNGFSDAKKDLEHQCEVL